MDALDEAVVSHFIPSVQLTGSRREQLRKLDTLIHHLLQVRDVLAGEVSPPASIFRSCRVSGSGRAFTSGVAAGVTIAVLIAAAIRWVV